MERRLHLEWACRARFNRSPPALHLNQTRMKIAEQHKLLYCSIPKTGSTFWGRTLTIVENGQFYSSLLEYRNTKEKRTLNKLIHLDTYLYQNNASAVSSFMNDAISFMFVREPYGRIFSAYNNKVLNPNIEFWKKIGREVIAKVRNNPSPDSLKYGHDVTFPEMVRFLILMFETGGEINEHFLPMNGKCRPCHTRFDYIGKMESFADDAHFILGKLRSKYRDVFVNFGDFDTDEVLTSAKGHVGFLYQTLRATQGLNYSKYLLFLRTWRDLQIRGALSKHIDMPVTQEQALNITQNRFFGLIKEALNKPCNSTEVKKQRTEAMIQAYRMVPLADMERLSKYVELDCQLFAYEVKPAMLFDRNSTAYQVSFNYFDGI